VVVTNHSRQGDTYQLELVDLTGHMVSGATAKLPLLKPNQTVQPPLVSASNHLAYYLDGDIDIRSLDPSGHTALVKTIAAGANAILAFAVSPDDQRIAVATITQASDDAKDTGLGYVEDLAGQGVNRVALWNNSKTSALRWPIGWHGQNLVDDIDDCQIPSNYDGNGPIPQQACSYHVVDSRSGNRAAVVCEN